ncbi:MAG: hypothetical protein GWN13_30290 [Phycisphaerae bacterium]|nr:hypothetical protein [candidate division Zixibacteria bacterium]NIX02452.1 hypothetical protein [Phycisphaerae bacterium]
MNIRALLLLFFVIVFVSACGPRPLHPGFDKFITDHPTEFSKVDQKAGYSIDEQSMKMEYVFRSMTAGGGLVMPGLMLKDYLDTSGPAAFKEMSEDPGKSAPLHLSFHINSFKFEGFQTHLDLHVTAERNGKQVLDKDYQAQGQKQGGKMFWGGAWAQRHAVHSSTQSSLNTIFNELLTDLK